MAGKQSDTLLFPRRKRHLFPSIAASPFQPFSLPSPQGKQTSPSLEWMKTVWRRGEERKESKAIRGGDSRAFFLFCRNWGEIGRSVGLWWWVLFAVEANAGSSSLRLPQTRGRKEMEVGMWGGRRKRKVDPIRITALLRATEGKALLQRKP